MILDEYNRLNSTNGAFSRRQLAAWAKNEFKLAQAIHVDKITRIVRQAKNIRQFELWAR